MIYMYINGYLTSTSYSLEMSNIYDSLFLNTYAKYTIYSVLYLFIYSNNVNAALNITTQKI